MIWKTKTHEFSATVCQRTGKTCPALAQLARAMTQALTQAGPVTTSQFQIEGSSELTHCPQGCTARFRAHPDQIRVYCGMDDDVSGDCLEDYADMMFGTEFKSLPTSILPNLPCAMLEASALSPQPQVNISQQLSA